MPTKEQLRSRLINKLQELFQLNQPDLDFGFYRIMHAKARQVKEFIDKDLLKIVEEAFGQVDESRKAELKGKIDEAIEQAKKYGAPDPENTPAVREARDLYAATLDTASAEADVYDDLYRFFERYYDDGDFISRRYITRETPSKAAPFAVPHNGEEVKLYWANADQYYIKTTEYFSNFTFDLRQAKEIRVLDDKSHPGLQWDAGDIIPRKVHFRIVDAVEGEHGNIKESETSRRYFIIHNSQPVEFTDDGELVINFEYRTDPEKTGQEGSWREKRNSEALTKALAKIEDVAKTDPRAAEYLTLLRIPAPTESDKKRPVLAKYINHYTARNTMDYFIHKDLGSFLSRELDFYIKNEVMRLDDIESAEAPAVESYITKLKVLRKIAGKLIDFLAQLEDFQKKLWLKKKFVFETNYCITLDRIPKEFYPEIIDNKAQHDEWVKLFAINEMVPLGGNPETTATPVYSKPLTVEFLKANDKLVLDTQFFTDSFKARLLASIDNFDEQCNGLLIHSENFQALNLLRERYWEQVKCIYIDPPYNTNASEIIYKNGYKNSSWNCLIEEVLQKSLPILQANALVCITIDDLEISNLIAIGDKVFGPDNHQATVCIRNNPSGRSTVKGFSINHEYGLFYSKNDEYTILGRLPHTEAQTNRYDEHDQVGSSYEWENFRKNGTDSDRPDRPKQFYPFWFNEKTDVLRVPKMEWNESDNSWRILELMDGDTEVEILPIDDKGTEKVWKFGRERALKEIAEFLVKDNRKALQIYRKKYINPQGSLPRTWWDNPLYSARDTGTRDIRNLFGYSTAFDFPKSVYAVIDSIRIGLNSENGTTLDFFAGSGTTGHAVINLNREDNHKEEDSGQRKYILVEIADYFDTVLKPRIVKVVYSEDWKDGKPTSRNTGTSHCLKYLRLESYEDTLNNLEFNDNPTSTEAIAANALLKEDFMLHYLLDVEARGSQSLLNTDHFSDPTAYKLKIKKPGSDEQIEKAIDLIETFNYLTGLRVNHVTVPQTLNANFKRLSDPELPKDQHTST